jgi:hypothetical protein
MSAYKTCLAIVKDFTAEDFADLERRAQEYANGKTLTNEHFELAAKDVIATLESDIKTIESGLEAAPMVLTEAEKAEKAWDAVAKDFPGAPTFAELTKAQQETFTEYGEANWTPDDVRTEILKLAKAQQKPATESKPAAPRAPSTEVVEFNGRRGNASNESAVASLRTISEDDDIALDDESRVGAVMLENIYRTRDGKPGRAAALLKQITQWADKTGTKLVLMPSGEIAGSREALVAWYERNGFVMQSDGAMERTAQQLTDESNVIDVEARVVQETVGKAVLALPEPQVSQLERHYGLKRGTQEFLARVKEDVVTFVNRGAEAVSAAIRDAIKAIAGGVIAMAGVFNPAALDNNFAFDIGKVAAAQVQTEAVEIRDQVPLSAVGKMSELAQNVYENMAPVAKQTGKGFIIADKPNGMIHIFKKDGSLLGQFATLYGKDSGDLPGAVSSLEGGKKVTPAGTYTLQPTASDEYAGGVTLKLKETEDATGYIAIHAVWLGDPSEARQFRLRSTTSADNKVTYGCMNIDMQEFVSQIAPNVELLNGGMIFVLPDAKETTLSMFPAQKKAVTRTVAAPAQSGMRFGVSGKVANPYTAAQLKKELSEFIRADIADRKVMIVDSVEDLIGHPDRDVRVVGASLAVKGAFGVAANGRAYLVANRIEQGDGRAKFMHEVGSHLGLDKLLPKRVYDRLTQQIINWAKANDGSVESQLAMLAAERVMNANTPKADQRAELLAYFIEEAVQGGIDPTAQTLKASSALREWFRTLWAAFKVAMRKLGLKPESLKAEDIVNLAYGAARLEVAGTWHGTAAEFRNFRNKYIGSGEGATAYGWGTYLAQKVGIAKGYWTADLQRKGLPTPKELALEIKTAKERIAELRGNNPKNLFTDKPMSPEQVAQELKDWESKVASLEATPQGNLMRVDLAVDDERMYDYDKPISKQPGYVADKLMALLEPHADEIVDRTNLDVAELTGKDLIGTGERDLGLLSQLIMDDVISLPAGQDAKFDDAVRRGKFHEAASHLLRELGLDGIKFLDAKSRGSATKVVSYDGQKYDRDELRDELRNASGDEATAFMVLSDVLRNGLAETKAALERRVASYEQNAVETNRAVAERYGVAFNEAQARAEAKKRALASLSQAKQLEWLNANEATIFLSENPKTRNIVVFDDKNIFRVGSEIGADVQRMRFGVNSAIDRMPQQLRAPVRGVTTNMWAGVKKAGLALAITEDVVKLASKYMRSAPSFLAAQYKKQAVRLGLELQVDKLLSRFERLNKPVQDVVNDFIHDSTMAEAWGYYPGQHRIGTQLINIDPDLEQRFQAIEAQNPEAAQLIKDVFEHGYQMMLLKQRTIEAAVDREFATREQAASGDPEALKDIAKEKRLMKKRQMSIQRVDVDKPYAYLGRHGDYIVVAKSKEFKHYQERAQMNDWDRDMARAWIDDHISDGDHYVVQFTETQGEADAVAAQLEATGKYDVVAEDAGAKEFDASYTGGDAFMSVARLRKMLDAQGGNASPELERLVSQLYLTTLAEASARKSELQRRKVAGADKNMMRNLATRGRADAHFVSTAMFNDDILDAMDNMAREARTGNRREAMPIYNELAKRTFGDMQYRTPSPLSKGVTQLTTVYYLSTNPAFYLQQLLQTSVLSLPFMAGRVGYFRSARAIQQAYKDTAALVKGLGVNDHVDFRKAPADVQAMLQKLVGMGKIDISIDSDARAQVGDMSVGSKVMRKLQGVNNRIETINRATAAIAAYRAYLNRYGADKTQRLSSLLPRLCPTPTAPTTASTPRAR